MSLKPSTNFYDNRTYQSLLSLNPIENRRPQIVISNTSAGKKNESNIHQEACKTHTFSLVHIQLHQASFEKIAEHIIS